MESDCSSCLLGQNGVCVRCKFCGISVEVNISEQTKHEKLDGKTEAYGLVRLLHQTSSSWQLL